MNLAKFIRLLIICGPNTKKSLLAAKRLPHIHGNVPTNLSSNIKKGSHSKLVNNQMPKLLYEISVK